MDTELKEVYVPVPCPHIVWYLEKRCDFALFFFFLKKLIPGRRLDQAGIPNNKLFLWVSVFVSRIYFHFYYKYIEHYYNKL